MKGLLLLTCCLLLTGCASQNQSKQNAVILTTGHPVVDAASHLATGLYLESKSPARPVATDDPQVKALNDAIEQAKSRQLMERAGTTAKPKKDDQSG